MIGLLCDITDLIYVWLKKRSFYVSIDGKNSILYGLLLGTVQVSVLGPILYAIFVVPIFDVCNLTLFADYNFIPRCNLDINFLFQFANFYIFFWWFGNKILRNNFNKLDKFNNFNNNSKFSNLKNRLNQYFLT
jgi:hypothetical protein